MKDKQHASMRFQNLPRKEYFEGWYFKHVSPDEQVVISFIPGLSVSKGAAKPFVQVILAEKREDAWHSRTDWLNYSEPLVGEEPFSFQLGENHFSRDGLRLAFQGEKLQVFGSLTFSDGVPLPSSNWAPTVMGPFSYLPGMECIHSVISLNHSLQGSLKINGRLVDFSRGKGYIEKDWGSSFPKHYVWLQSNHFSQEASLFFSWADIPVMGTSFKGYIAHLYYQGRHHRFATYTRGHCRLNTIENGVRIVLTNKDSELQITALQSGSAELLAPHRGEMIHTIKEGLYGRVAFCLKDLHSQEQFCDQTELAGLEIVWAKGQKKPENISSGQEA